MARKARRTSSPSDRLQYRLYSAKERGATSMYENLTREGKEKSQGAQGAIRISES